MRIVLLFLLTLLPACGQWQPQTSGTDVSLRGISAVSDRIAWVGRAKGTVLGTVDGGEHWTNAALEGARARGFCHIQPRDAHTVHVLGFVPVALWRIGR